MPRLGSAAAFIGFGRDEPVREVVLENCAKCIDSAEGAASTSQEEAKMFQQAVNCNRNVPVRPNWFLQVAGLALFLATVGCGSSGKNSAAVSIPPIASLAKIQIGFSSEDDLEKTWGNGLTTVGSHPNSGEEWRVPGTHWLIFIDGFYYSKRGLVVDTLSISEVPDISADSDAAESWRHAPDARLGKQAFAWMGDISLGMPRDKVMEALKKHSLTFTQADGDIGLQARGFSPVTSEALYDFRAWGVMLKFEHDQLSKFIINAGLERDKKYTPQNEH